jgi:hypothetical protein
MTTHSAFVSSGHGDTTMSTGAKKKPSPMNQAEPARSDLSTNRNHRGMDGGAWA